MTERGNMRPSRDVVGARVFAALVDNADAYFDGMREYGEFCTRSAALWDDAKRLGVDSDVCAMWRAFAAVRRG